MLPSWLSETERGDDRKWIASFDGFYLTRGHYFNNASATLHDFITSDIAWFTHRTKRGPCHNWEGTSAGAEGEVMKNVKDANFVVKEIIIDKDFSTNAIFCRHFPEGTITYRSNHCAKTLHKDLEKIKGISVRLVLWIYKLIGRLQLLRLNSANQLAKHCSSRLATSFTYSARQTTLALSNLISSEKIQGSDDPLKSFSEAILNFHSHYCLDDHSSPWCCHEKVGILYLSLSNGS